MAAAPFSDEAFISLFNGYKHPDALTDFLKPRFHDGLDLVDVVETMASSITGMAGLRALLDLLPVSCGFSSPLFLDWGCGQGKMVVAAAYHGWGAFGIDFNLRAYGASISTLKDASTLFGSSLGSMQVAFGDFIPVDFDRQRSYDERYDLFAPYLQEKEVFVRGVNPYRELGVEIDQVDLFYHYQVERIDNLVNIFAQYAKPGSFLAINHLFGDASEPAGVERVPLPCGPLWLYRKEKEGNYNEMSFPLQERSSSRSSSNPATGMSSSK